jgi:hypothetical protein
MKLSYFKVASGLCALSLVPEARAALNNLNLFGKQNISTSYYSQSVTVENSTHIYLDTKPLVESVNGLTESNQLLAMSSAERERLRKYYSLDELGPAIGVDIDSADSSAFVRKYGVDGFQKVIEDRLFYLKTNQILTESMVSSLSKAPLDQQLASRASRFGNINPVEVVPVIDHLRRHPQEDALQSYLSLTNDEANVHLRKAKEVFLAKDKKLSQDESKDVMAALVYLNKRALELGDPPVDFGGLDYQNLSSNADALGSIAASYRLGFDRALKSDELSRKIETCKKLNDTLYELYGVGGQGNEAPASSSSDYLQDYYGKIWKKQHADGFDKVLNRFSETGEDSIRAGEELIAYHKNFSERLRAQLADPALSPHVSKQKEIDERLRTTQQGIASTRAEVDQLQAKHAERVSKVWDEFRKNKSWYDFWSSGEDRVANDDVASTLNRQLYKARGRLQDLEYDLDRYQSSDFIEDVKNLKESHEAKQQTFENFVNGEGRTSTISRLQDLLKKDGQCDFLRRVSRGAELMAASTKADESIPTARTPETKKAGHAQ